MNGLEREPAECRACLAATTVMSLMCGMLADESLRNGRGEIDGVYNYIRDPTIAEMSKALRDAEKRTKDAINSKQAEAWLGLCVDMACKSLSSAQSGDEAIALSTANECIGTCTEALQVLDVYADKTIDSVFA